MGKIPHVIDLSEVKSIDEMTDEEIRADSKLQEYFRKHNITYNGRSMNPVADQELFI